MSFICLLPQITPWQISASSSSIPSHPCLPISIFTSFRGMPETATLQIIWCCSQNSSKPFWCHAHVEMCSLHNKARHKGYNCNNKCKACQELFLPSLSHAILRKNESFGCYFIMQEKIHTKSDLFSYRNVSTRQHACNALSHQGKVFLIVRLKSEEATVCHIFFLSVSLPVQHSSLFTVTC